MARTGVLIALLIVVIIIIAAIIGFTYYYLYGSSGSASTSSQATASSGSGSGSVSGSAEQPPIAGGANVDSVIGVTPNSDAADSGVDNSSTYESQPPPLTTIVPSANVTSLSTDGGSATLTRFMGIHAPATCPSGSTCAYGIIRATGRDCRALGGAMNGSPADSEWTDCHVNIGRGSSVGGATTRGFHAPGTCPSGNCQYGAVAMTGASCRALGGAMNGSPGDGDMTLCHFNVGANPKWGFYGEDDCPAGSTCFPTRIRALGSQCRAIGGSTATETDDWTDCSLNFGIS